MTTTGIGATLSMLACFRFRTLYAGESTGMIDRKTRLGKTDLVVPALCFGTSGLGDMPGTYGYSTPEERAFETIKHILGSDFPFPQHPTTQKRAACTPLAERRLTGAPDA